MTRQPRYATPLAVYPVMLLTCISLFISLSSCSRTRRNDTLRASVTAVNAARAGFTTWDRQHQQDIVAKATSKDEGRAALDRYRGLREAILDDFELVYRALAIAATQTDDPSLKGALAASAKLIGSVQSMTGGP